MRVLIKPNLAKTQKSLDKKRSRLIELEDKLDKTSNPASRASFKGKITRCHRDIDILERRLENCN